MNHAYAEAETRGAGWLGGSPFWSGKYGIAKNIISDGLDNGGASKSSRGKTKSAISAGTIIITDAEAQKERAGLTPEESIGRLRRNTADTQNAAGQIGLSSLERQAQDIRAAKNGVEEQGFKIADDSYNTMRIKPHPLVDARMNAKGTDYVDYHEMSPDGIYKLKLGADGAVHIFANGIFTDEHGAVRFAGQMMGQGNPGGHIYVKAYPMADTTLGELGVAVYQWSAEKFPQIFGYNRSVSELLPLQKYGKIKLGCYSRGAMTCGTLLSVWKSKSAKGSMPGLSVDMYGPAYPAGSMNKSVKYLSGKDGQVTFENNRGDLVGKLASWNKVTSGPKAETKNWLIEGAEMFQKPDSAHGCYGANAGSSCRHYDTKTITAGKKSKP